jgi:hypothetical protein
VPLLTAGNFAELLLRHALHEALETGENLMDILRIGDLQLWPADQLLDTCETVADEMLAQPIVHFLEDQLSEPSILALARVKHTIDETALLQLTRSDALTHDERLIALGHTQPLHQGPRSTALGHETERGEGREEEGVGRAVDEVGKGDEGGGEANDGPVEADDEDLGVRAEGVSDVEVEGDEALQPVSVQIGCVLRGGLAADGHICASVCMKSLSAIYIFSIELTWFQ